MWLVPNVPHVMCLCPSMFVVLNFVSNRVFADLLVGHFLFARSMRHIEQVRILQEPHAMVVCQLVERKAF